MVSVAITQEYQEIDLSPSKLEQLVSLICRQHEVVDGQVSLAVIDDQRAIEINRAYLEREGTTDCFSFDLSDDPGASHGRVFEVLVNGQMAQRESEKRGHSAEAELALYVTHGLLHNLGFDDINDALSEKMHAREDEILQHFGYGVVYHKDVL